MKASLIYYWRIHLAVFAGTAIGVAVLTGALGVGDSVRESLRVWNLEKLGRTHVALQRESFLRQALLDDLIRELSAGSEKIHAIGLVSTRGSATQPETKARMGRVAVYGVEPNFAHLVFPNDPFSAPEDLTAHLADADAAVFAPVVINERLGRELRCRKGDQIILNLEVHSPIHRDSLFGNKSSENLIAGFRGEIAHVLPNRGLGRFSLQTSQRVPGVAFVPLKALQRTLNVPEKINTVLVTGDAQSRISPGRMHRALARAFQIEDAGIHMSRHQDAWMLESDDWSFKQAATDAIFDTAESMGAQATPVFAYLANRITCGDRVMPYSAVAAVEADNPRMDFTPIDDDALAALGDDEIILNSWAAEDLNASAGDAVTMEYYVVHRDDTLETNTAAFRVAGIVAMTGSGADARLSPDVPGIHDAEDMGSWDPPFSMDFDLIRPKDEDYWDQYRGAPKAFVSWETGQKLWKSRFGHATAVFLSAPESRSEHAFTRDFKDALGNALSPETCGYRFDDVRSANRAAARGNTDFGMLFIGFSMFIIAAATLLVGMLFKLGVEQRGGEIGLLAAVGFTAHRIRWRFLAEGCMLAICGGLTGLPIAKLYLDIMIYGLAHWWNLGLDRSLLEPHVLPTTFTVGFSIGVAVTIGTLWLTLRSLTRVTPLNLLHRQLSPLDASSTGRTAKIWMSIAAMGGMTTLIAAWALDKTDSAMAFFLAGVFFLVAGLAGFAALMKQPTIRPTGGMFVIRLLLAVRNLVRHPGRNLLCVALVACACFVLATVGLNRRNEAQESLHIPGPAGGFGIWATCEIPLHLDLNSADDRFTLGIPESLSQTLDECRVHGFRFLPGDDASCLNLQAPTRPHILGVPNPQAMIGRFEFQEKLENTHQDPWRLLNEDLGADVIPAIADYESARWIMHKKLGDDVTVIDEVGRKVKIRLVGLLKKSMMQSEIMISEDRFIAHFPSQSGTAYFLIDAPKAMLDPLARELEEALADYGWDSELTKHKIWSYKAVVNTYLAVFQVLGGLGLVLGSLGLGIVMYRNIMERRKELGCLRAVGFSSRSIFGILLAENALLILVGILAGVGAALISGIPHFASTGFSPPLAGFAALIAFVAICGIGTGFLAIHAALKRPLLEELKSE